MYHSLSFLNEEHLGFSQFRTIMNKTSKNICIWAFEKYMFSFSLGKFLWIRCQFVWHVCLMLPTCLFQFALYESSSCSASLRLGVTNLFWFELFNLYGMVSHCAFIFISPMSVLCGDSILIVCPFRNEIIHFLIVSFWLLCSIPLIYASVLLLKPHCLLLQLYSRSLNFVV